MATDTEIHDQGSVVCTPTQMDSSSADQYESSSDLTPAEEFKEPLPPSPIGDDAQADSQSKDEKADIVEEKIMVTSKPTVEREGNCYW